MAYHCSHDCVGYKSCVNAGIIIALSTYAAQSINYHDPIRQGMFLKSDKIILNTHIKK